MKYFKSIKQNEELTEALFEIPASFFFVLMYFVLIEHVVKANFHVEIIAAPVIFFVIYYIEYLIFAPKATIHILPVVSFIDSLVKNDFTVFLYRLPGQLLGTLAATLLHFSGIKYGPDADFTSIFTPMHPFFTALFTGFVSQVIYFLYFFPLLKLKTGLSFRYLLFSFGLGAVFFIVSYIDSISLLNPFGILFHYFLDGNVITVKMLLYGSIIHIVVPMFFIAETHYFIKGYKNLTGYTSWFTQK